MKKITKLELFKKARTHFSKKENKFDMGPNETTMDFNRGLCSFISELYESELISYSVFDKLDNKIHKSVMSAQRKTGREREFKYLYFPTNKDRLNFINSQIKQLTKK